MCETSYFLQLIALLSFQVIYFKEGKYSLLFLNPNTSTRELILIIVMNLRVVQGNRNDKYLYKHNSPFEFLTCVRWLKTKMIALSDEVFSVCRCNT